MTVHTEITPVESDAPPIHPRPPINRLPADDVGRALPAEPPEPGRARRLAAALQTRLRPIWADHRLGLAVAVSVGAAWGLAAGWWTPRGPLTSADALWSIVVSLLVGGLAGFTTRSRWAMMTAPVAFVAAFELARVGVDGPTVDAIRTSTYGLMALVVGRGFHTLLSVVPMLLGAAVGAATARGLAGDVPSGRSAARHAWRGVAILTAGGLAALSIGLARPASTAAIHDADGNVIPGSVAELTTVDVNGHDLAMMIRGHSVDNPVLLFLAGGPGGSELGAMRNHLRELETHFTVVTWDQRGTGKSYPELDPVDSITLDGFVADTIVVTDYLRDRFGQEQIYLLGQSWGTTLGVLAVQAAPERYLAFIGTGQMVSQRATDRIFYADTLEWARANGKNELVDDLVEIGPPPYDDILNYETALANEQDVYRYDHRQNSEGEGQMSENLIVPEYTLIDQVHVLGAFLDTFSVLYPQLQDIDFRLTATEFEVPVFFVQGEHEAPGRSELFDDWYPMIDAPSKDLTIMETSGHRPLWEQPDEFVEYMTDVVLATTATATPEVIGDQGRSDAAGTGGST